MIEVYEAYSPLDELGRCGTATACLGPETLPPEGERRADIGHVRPSGWHTTAYDQHLVPGESLFNRTHLIARCLCETGDIPQNLITGTQHLNQSTMQPLENRVVDYIRHTNNHVLYRVTPFFEPDELVARSLRLEARSIEDNGEGISIDMRCYNVQPGVIINYATGESHCAEAAPSSTLSMKGYLLGNPAKTFPETTEALVETTAFYVLNFLSRRFHLGSCKAVDDMVAKNEGFCHLDQNTLMALEYQPCGCCIA